MTHIDPFWVNVIVATVIPMLTALVTARVAADAVKALILAILAALGTALGQVINGDFVWDSFLKTTVLVFLGAVGLHFGLLKPAGITGSGGAIQTAAPLGVGQPPRHAAP